MQDFYRCEEGSLERENEVASKAYQKLVHDMIYEARVGIVVFYFAKHKKQKIMKEQARK
jgi:hypothetical protein